MISINKLHFAYSDGPFSLQIPELVLESGRSVVIVGPSGSGKTTLLHLIAGILPVLQGEICIGEMKINELSDAERRLFRLRSIGLVFQDFQLIDYLSVLDNVLLPCRIHPSVSLNSEIRRRAGTLLESVGLSTLQERPVTRLSHGERQRVAICRALLLSPQVVLADEPTGNLDPENSDRIVKLLHREAANSAAMLVMVTHDHSLIPHFDRVVPFQHFLRRNEPSSSLTGGAAS